MSDPVARLEQLLAAASPLPWKEHEYFNEAIVDSNGAYLGGMEDCKQGYHDATIAKAAVNALPRFLEIVKKYLSEHPEESF